MAFATIEQFIARCPNALSDREIEVASILLEDAADMISRNVKRNRGEVDDIPAYTLERINCAMVSRLMDSARQSDEFNYPADSSFMKESWYDFNGQLRLTADDLRDLGITRNATNAAFVGWPR